MARHGPTTKPGPPLIAAVKLDRIESDLQRITRRNPADGPTLSRFMYDHSHTIVVDSSGRQDLLIQNTVPLASDIARLLQHTSPAIVGELVRGYRLWMETLDTSKAQ